MIAESHNTCYKWWVLEGQAQLQQQRNSALDSCHDWHLRVCLLKKVGTIYFSGWVRTKGGDKVPKGPPMNSSIDPIKLKTFVALMTDVTSASPRVRYMNGGMDEDWGHVDLALWASVEVPIASTYTEVLSDLKLRLSLNTTYFCGWLNLKVWS